MIINCLIPLRQLLILLRIVYSFNFAVKIEKAYQVWRSQKSRIKVKPNTMKNQRKFKLTPFFLAVLLVSMTLFAFDNKNETEDTGPIVAWTRTPLSLCNEVFLVDCTATPNPVNCTNLAGKRLWKQSRDVKCTIPLYKCPE